MAAILKWPSSFCGNLKRFSDACPHVARFVTQNDLADAMPDCRNSFADTKMPGLLPRGGFPADLVTKGNDL